MVKPKIKFTYTDYKNLPESETKRHELLDGEIVMVPSPTPYHQRISVNLGHIIWDFVHKHQIGVIYTAPLDVVFSEWDVAQPDILFITKERLEIITEENIQGAPDLIIEILSPKTAERDRTYKRTLYARHGVKEYWIVDPETKTIEVAALTERGLKTVQIYKAGETLSSPLLKGLSLSLEEIF